MKDQRIFTRDFILAFAAAGLAAALAGCEKRRAVARDLLNQRNIRF